MTHAHIRIECRQCGTVLIQCRCLGDGKATGYQTCADCHKFSELVDRAIEEHSDVLDDLNKQGD